MKQLELRQRQLRWFLARLFRIKLYGGSTNWYATVRHENGINFAISNEMCF